MLTTNVFQKEVQLLNSQINALNAEDFQDFTDARLAQERIWELEEIKAYFEKRIKELS